MLLLRDYSLKEWKNGYLIAISIQLLFLHYNILWDNMDNVYSERVIKGTERKSDDHNPRLKTRQKH